jgi:hypothetical protein
MDQSSSGCLEVLQTVARGGEQDPARQRQIDALRHGHRTTEAEAVLQRFEAIHQALLS